MFCWYCSRKFQLNKKTGLEIFVTIKGPLGQDHKVHKVCKEEAIRTSKPDRVVKPASKN